MGMVRRARAARRYFVAPRLPRRALAVSVGHNTKLNHDIEANRACGKRRRAGTKRRRFRNPFSKDDEIPKRRCLPCPGLELGIAKYLFIVRNWWMMPQDRKTAIVATVGPSTWDREGT